MEQELVQGENKVPQQKRITYITAANGIKILSKLNPKAKEFYPAYILLQKASKLSENIVKDKNDVDAKNLTDDVKKEIPDKVEVVEKNIALGDTQILKEDQEANMVVNKHELRNEDINEEKCANKIENTLESKRKDDDDDDEIIVEAEKQKYEILHKAQIETKASVAPENKEIEMKKMENINMTTDERKCVENVSVCIMKRKDPIKTKTLLKTKNIKKSKEKDKCGDTATESVGDVGGGVVHSVEINTINNVQKECENDSIAKAEINQRMEHQKHLKTNVKKKDTDVGKIAPAKPANETSVKKDQNNQMKLLDENSSKSNITNDNKRKPEKKKSTLKKFSSIALSVTSRKSSAVGQNESADTASSTTIDGATKPTSSTNCTALSTCTKRISEGLLNLTTALKSKSDLKKSEAGLRIAPRPGSTAIPRTVVRSRTMSSKLLTEDNDAYKNKTKLLSKDTISLRSTNSTEKNVTSGKSASTSTKICDKPTTTNTTNKEVTQRIPRSTVASSLRQTEAKKRRHLFPNDPDAESNVELTQFLFK